ncbi:tripartite tricarboxylate transporter substrate binding protein [Bradyrhizobium prioriisuperbiae]|uniref:Bug family tripartite tricarboxylate transporter substrate binding protein n=1 Tax=Bradyrhizobium prioriisuperbiae TaxID=2854389 RepID=UPI0028EAB139|nr:tripartite tricarboxylate transporter substrate binding protein [Bradyrhizobium prioritasuperba]
MQGLALIAFVMCTSPAVKAQGYPNRPITIKLAFPAGGPADVSVRAANVVLQRNLGPSLITENVPGASGSIGVLAALKATPDGYTLLGTTGTDFLVAPFVVPAAKYEPEKFRLLGVVGISDFVLLSSNTLSFRNIDELIEYARKPGSKMLTLAHWGTGSTPHIVGADFQGRTNTKFLEVPYKGVAPVLADMSGGHIDLTFAPLGGSTLSLIQSGQVKAIAVASAERNPALPDVPTMSESASLRSFEYSLWSALFAPPGTPEPVVARLNEALNVWNTSDDNLARIKANASRRLEPMSVDQADAFLKSERDKYIAMVRALNLQAQ